MEEYKDDVIIKGEMFGVDFSQRGTDDNHIMLDIYSCGKRLWFKDNSFSSHWIDDLINVLIDTKHTLETQYEKQEDGYGYKFKEAK